jgi:hypothetical protein
MIEVVFWIGCTKQFIRQFYGYVQSSACNGFATG